MAIQSTRSWGHRPLWGWVIAGLLILGAGYVGWRIWNSSGRMGDDCEDNTDCRSKLCLFEKGRNLKYCTDRCESTDECPESWVCMESPDFVYRKVCIQP